MEPIRNFDCIFCCRKLLLCWALKDFTAA